MLTDLDRKIIAAIQDDLPIAKRPYARIARQMGVSEAEFLDKLRDLNARGIIRRFGATLRHQKSGFSANAMVAWKVDTDRIDAVGRRLAEFREVSHCYHRKPNGQWRYNLYTMIHAANEAACRDVAAAMALAVGVEDYTLLFSRKELKKTSMIYFPDDV
jgi:DNA-binding Lrp family transcriptional regulator